MFESSLELSQREDSNESLQRFFYGKIQKITCKLPIISFIWSGEYQLHTIALTLLHSERPNLHRVLAKTLWSFGPSECKRVKITFHEVMVIHMLCFVYLQILYRLDILHHLRN